MKKRKRAKRKQKRTSSGASFFVFLATSLVIGLLLAYALSGSLWSTRPEQLQFVVYGSDTRVYSLGLSENIHHMMRFPANYKVEVPGGYGQYRVGALGHLVNSEDKPELLLHTFSVANAAFVQYYFYNDQGKEVFYSGSEKEKVSPPPLLSLFQMRSNATFFDRAYIAYRSLQMKRSEIIGINIDEVAEKDPVNGDTVLSMSKLRDTYAGYLFNKTYRTERYNVQIAYTKSYKTAVRIGSILENMGIRVADISASNVKDKKGCIVRHLGIEDSQTVKDIAAFFSCDSIKADTGIHDIVLELGELERSWEIN